MSECCDRRSEEIAREIELKGQCVTALTSGIIVAHCAKLARSTIAKPKTCQHRWVGGFDDGHLRCSRIGCEATVRELELPEPKKPDTSATDCKDDTFGYYRLTTPCANYDLMRVGDKLYRMDPACCLPLYGVILKRGPLPPEDWALPRWGIDCHQQKSSKTREQVQAADDVREGDLVRIDAGIATVVR